MYIKLNNNKVDHKTKIKGSINLPKGFLSSTKIKSLNCLVDGYLDKSLNITLKVKGQIKITTIYPFELEIYENVAKYLPNNQNKLDINLIVWENILLEVPINFMEENKGSILDIIPESGRSEYNGSTV